MAVPLLSINIALLFSLERRIAVVLLPLRNVVGCALVEVRYSYPIEKTNERTNMTDAAVMQIIQPRNDDPAVDLLERLDKFLRMPRVRKKIRELTLQGNKGVRAIQGDRYEIFLQARFKESTAFDDWIAADMLAQGETKGHVNPQQVKDIILNYAKSQAKQDPRIGNHEEYKFDNFSLLVNFKKVDAQFSHIDLQAPNFQFGLMVTNNSPGTIVYHPAFQVRTIQQLKRAWTDLPDTVAQAIQNDWGAMDLLELFGDVLCPDIQKISAPRSLKTGTLCSLPGSVIHAGPDCNKPRVVLFFSATPKDSPAADYNPDVQYFAPLLCCDLVTMLWSQLTVTDRSFLLTKLADCMTKYRNLFRHLSDKSMIDFTRGLGYGKYERGQRQLYIEKFASRGDPDGETGMLVATEQVGGGALDATEGAGMELVSVDGLMAKWEGVSFPVQVYRSVDDDSVCLYYPSDNTWEGRNKHYSLRMKQRKRTRRQQLFDGRNGSLLDEEGNLIVCSTGASK